MTRWVQDTWVTLVRKDVQVALDGVLANNQGTAELCSYSKVYRLLREKRGT